MIELSQGFGFEAAHSLVRGIGAEASARVHGHSYQAELVLRGPAAGADGMLVDLGRVERTIGRVRDALDHRLLDEVDGLGTGTMENLARWIFEFARADLPLLAAVVVRRDSLSQRCRYAPADAAGDGPAGP